MAPPRPRGRGAELGLLAALPDPQSSTIVRIEAYAYAVPFIRTIETRIAMIRLFYSRDHLRPLGHIRILRAGASVLRRVYD